MNKQNITRNQLIESQLIDSKLNEQFRLNELFTIGRMIKLLEDKNFDLLICKSKYDTGDKWEVTLIDDSVFIQEELCDALWNAVLEVYSERK